MGKHFVKSRGLYISQQDFDQQVCMSGHLFLFSGLWERTNQALRFQCRLQCVSWGSSQSRGRWGRKLSKLLRQMMIGRGIWGSKVLKNKTKKPNAVFIIFFQCLFFSWRSILFNSSTRNILIELIPFPCWKERVSYCLIVDLTDCQFAAPDLLRSM